MERAVLLPILALLLADVANAGPLVIEDVAHPRSLLDIANDSSTTHSAVAVKPLNIKPIIVKPIKIRPINNNSVNANSYVKVDYQGETLDKISRYIKPAAGKTYLFVNISIANHGYKKVWANPNSFYVKIDNVKYGYDSMSGMLNDTDIPMLNLNGNLGDGERASGYLVFQVPANFAEYSLVYEYAGAPNVIYN